MFVKTEKTELLVDKYRPTKWKEVVGNNDILKDIVDMLRNKTITHMIFVGPAGTGKNTVAYLIAKFFYKTKIELIQGFKELNASEKNSIKVIREDVKGWAETSWGDTFRIIFLDEADNISKPAQQALRRIIEMNQDNCRFIFSCNYGNEIIDPIYSRCAIFEFKKIEVPQIHKRLKYIRDKEHIKADDEILLVIAKKARGDMRKAINYLEKIRFKKEISLEDVLKLAPDTKIKMAIDLAFKQKLVSSIKKFYEILNGDGMDIRELLVETGKIIFESDNYPELLKANMFIHISETEHKVNLGSSSENAINCLASEFLKLGRLVKRKAK
jgi:replication factor C small subunit